MPITAVAAISETAAIVVGTVLAFVVFFGYPISEAFRGGQTPGKKMLGIRVVTTEGGPLQVRHAAVRALVGFAEFFLILGGLIATIAALVSKRSQRIGDLAAGTIVVRLESALAQPIFFPPVQGHEEYCRRFDAGGMAKDQFALLRDFMLRHDELSESASATLAARLASGLQRANVTPQPSWLSDVGYLQAAVFAYQQRFTFADGQAQAPMLPFLSSTYGAGYTTQAPPPPGAAPPPPGRLSWSVSTGPPPPPPPPPPNVRPGPPASPPYR